MKKDLSDLVFVYDNVVSFCNSVCLDIDVITRLAHFKNDGKITDKNYDLFHFIERRTYLSMVVTLDGIIDDPNGDREIDKKIRNDGLHLDKVLNLLQASFSGVKDQKQKNELMKTYNALRKIYNDMEAMPERKNLKILRDKFGAHFDRAFIKKEEYSEVDFTNIDALHIVGPVVQILEIVGTMIVSDKQLLAVVPCSPTRKTPIDNLF